MVERAAKWFRKDSLLNLHSNKIDLQMLEKKLYPYMCNFCEMPIQIWRENVVEDNEITASTIKTKVWSVPEFPIKSIIIKNENNLQIFREDFTIVSNTLAYENEIQYDIIEPVFVEVIYHHLNVSKKIGFPVDSEAVDEKYLPNTYLDEKAFEYGLHRRSYKDNIADLSKTLPVGYPYAIEQDYFLERRLLNEYRVQKETNEELDLGLFKAKILEDIHTTRTFQLTLYDHNDEYTLVVLENGELKEQFTDTLETLVDTINSESELIRVVRSNGIYTEPIFGELKQTGMFDRFGLLRSEIYQKLGVVPVIKNMDEYLLKWDTGSDWYGVFAGDEYVPGVFFVDIPIQKIPSNFELLPIQDIVDSDGSSTQGLQSICDICKPFGTIVIPQYVVYGEPAYLEFKDPEWLPPTTYVKESAELELDIGNVESRELNADGEEISVTTQARSVGLEFGEINVKTEETLFNPPPDTPPESHPNKLEFQCSITSHLISTILAHDVNSDYTKDALNDLVASSDNVVIYQGLKDVSDTPNSISITGSGLGWDNSSNVVDTNADSYGKSNSGASSLTASPNGVTETGSDIPFINRANLVDADPTSYAGSGALPSGSIEKHTPNSGIDVSQWSSGRDWNGLTYLKTGATPYPTIKAGTGWSKWARIDLNALFSSLPNDAIVKGIEVFTNTVCTGDGEYTVQINLSDGVDFGVAKSKLVNQKISGTYQWAGTIGSPTDTWGLPNDISNYKSNLTAHIRLNNTVSGVNGMSYVGVTVYWEHEAHVTNILTLTGSNFSIPADNIVTGIKVDVKCRCLVESQSLDVSTTVGSTTKLKTKNMPTTAGGVYLTFGGDGDMWGGLPTTFTSLTLKLQSKTAKQAYFWHIIVTVYTQNTSTWTKYAGLGGINFNLASTDEVQGIEIITKCYSAVSSKTLEATIIAGGYTSQVKTIVLPTTPGNVTLGANNDRWNLPATPATYNSVLVKLRTNAAGEDTRVYQVTIKVYHKSKSGVLMSERVIAVGDNWENLEVTKTTPAGTSITYDVIKPILDQQQIQSTSFYEFGKTYHYLAQSFVPTHSYLCGVVIKTHSKVGSPTDAVDVSIYSDNNGVPGERLRYFRIASAQWTNNTEIFIPFAVPLTTGQRYWITMRRSGELDSSNYYRVHGVAPGVYPNGELFDSSSGWVAKGGDLFFKTFYPVNLLTEQSAAKIGLQNIEHSDIQIKMTFNSNSVSVTPTLDKFLVTSQEEL